MIDTHAHLNHSDFADDLPQVLGRAEAAGVHIIVNVGYDLASIRDALLLAESHTGLYATVGLHPHSASEFDEHLLRDLRKLAQRPRVVAIGETGLDFYRDLSPRGQQVAAFRALAELAAETGLPLIVHNRDAHEETLAVLDTAGAGDAAVIMHCFQGDADFAEECRQRGYYLGVAGPITYPRSEALRAIVAAYPGKRLLLETDCPWLPPQPHRGHRNEPAFLPEIAAVVAEVRGEALCRLLQQVSENARRVFGLKGDTL